MIALILALAVQASPAEWKTSDTVSAVDGRRSYIAGVESTGMVRNIRGIEEKAMLGVACIGDRRRIALSWPGFLGVREVRVTWRIGDAAPRTDRFGVASGTSATFTGRGAERMIDAMRSGETAHIRVQGFQNTQEASFDLSQSAAALTSLDEACPR